MSEKLQVPLPTKLKIRLALSVSKTGRGRLMRSARRYQGGQTVRVLEQITARRNKIAHEGDRLGRSPWEPDRRRGSADPDALYGTVKALEVIIE